ncbi:DPP IV N-terminal domain-containing protein [Spirillospora sp. NPDC029432]|uniref:DPP IV N-terminal domain-containing protein n=1 Tax=Spirillospora sp. NPDC029432 TaxID=3154599 RepID=UPI0034511394
MAWSPDSTKVPAHRTDGRGVRLTHLLESRPADGGVRELRPQRYACPGDEHLPRAELVVFDVASGTAVHAQAEPLIMSQLSALEPFRPARASRSRRLTPCSLFPVPCFLPGRARAVTS